MASSTTSDDGAYSRAKAEPQSVEQQALCVSGTQYKTSEDDEFAHDSWLRTTSHEMGATPPPGQMEWSTQALGFTNGGTRNNVGTDDAYYTDPTRGFGGYDPFSLNDGALNITAEPVPAKYRGSSAGQLDGAHWLSGVLEGAPQTYGYVEVSAREPNLQGFWPAPLWLLGYHGADGKGNGYEELDVNELFGNALGKSVVQQTQIFNLSGRPPSNFVRTTVNPDPDTAYHTYGVLWTSKFVQYFIDRKARSAKFANGAYGPANPIIILQVFADNTWAPPPASASPQTLSLQYFRWYQASGGSCSPSELDAAHESPSPEPSPTATPTPTPRSDAAPTLIQDSGVIARPSPSGFIGYLNHAPHAGDVLLAVVNSAMSVSVPAGWTTLDAPSSTGFSLYSAIAGSSGVALATSYSFGVNAGELELLDVGGASTAIPVRAGSDPVQWVAAFPRSLAIPRSGGLLLTAWGGYSSAADGFTSIDEQLPSAQTETKIAANLNDPLASGGSFSLRVAQVTSEPYAAVQPFTMIGTIGVSGMWNLNGDLVWIAPR
jgi:hypothetical protein